MVSCNGTIFWLDYLAPRIFLYNISLSLVGRLSHVTMSAIGGSVIENFAGTPNKENLSTWSGSIARLVQPYIDMVVLRSTLDGSSRGLKKYKDITMEINMETSLVGKVALVAGATRGAGRGIAVQLGAAGATVYVTGRTSRSKRSEMNRPETIEETATLVDQAGGRRDRGPGRPSRARRG